MDPKHPAGDEQSGHAHYPTIDPSDLAPPPISTAAAADGAGVNPDAARAAANPYVSSSPAPPSKNPMDTAKEVLGRWGKKVGEATKKAEGLAGDVWQHLKTGPSVTDAAMGRIAHGTKVISEGGYDKIFRQSFETLPEEQLSKAYPCYLSTSTGPVVGVLYLSTSKIAFCSDNPLSYKVADKTEWSYYKVVVPLHQLRAATPSASQTNPAEKYIQVVSVEGHEFWFMGFMSYDGAVRSLQEALQTGVVPAAAP